MSEIVTRSFEFRSEDSDGQTLEGYAAVFNSPTLIDSVREGTFTEVIAPGAFAKTIAERTPVLQFDHGTHPLIGSLPLGTISTIREDEHGLYVRARLSDNWLIAPVRDAIKDGAIRGMSFRFTVLKDKKDRASNTRTVQEVKLHELGPVVFAAYASTSVGVRSSLVELLADDSVRSELATLLSFGRNVSVVEAEPVTSIDDPEPPPALGTPKDERLRAFRRAVPKLMELTKC